jgi:hypothetical protein
MDGRKLSGRSGDDARHWVTAELPPQIERIQSIGGIRENDRIAQWVQWQRQRMGVREGSIEEGHAAQA